MTHNPITALPKEIEGLSRLHAVDLRGNRVVEKEGKILATSAHLLTGNPPPKA